MYIHILRAPETTTEAEKEQLAGLDKYERRYLSRRVCGLCEWPLSEVGCGAYLPGPDCEAVEACEEQLRIDRRERCLKEYKPRYWSRKVV